MSDEEWRAYLDTLSPEMAALAYNTAERVNTIMNRERSRAIGERQELERKLGEQGAKINDLRTIVKDLFDRLAERKVNDDASNAATRSQS